MGSRRWQVDSLSNLEAWYEVFGRENELPKMLSFECPYDVFEERVLGRAKYTERIDDNVESLKQRFETFKAEMLLGLRPFPSKKS